MDLKTAGKTKVQKQLAAKAATIYSSLIKLGCNLLQPVEHSETMAATQIFFQASDSRLELIEWLVATINPWYDQDAAYRHSYGDDPHHFRVKKICISLWQLGVMPFSKHTKNLAYEKYVQGLLGAESSVNLIYDLVELANSKFSPNLPKNLETNAADLIGELITHHQELVNTNYDPFGITFPPSAPIGQDEEADQTLEEEYETLAHALDQEISSENSQDEELPLDETQKIFKQMQDYKQLFAHKYENLSRRMKELSEKYKKLAEGLDLSKQPERNSLHRARMLNIDRSLCASQREYKGLLTQIQPQSYSEDLKSENERLVEKINNLNSFDLQDFS